VLELVEREAALALLRQRLEGARGSGHIVLLSGEAGIGKTSVLRALAARREPVWWGACDALQTPQPLSPLLDICRQSATRLSPLLTGPRLALFEAVLDELRAATAPVLLVIEDVHWADEATLDLIRFLGRRIEATRALLVVSYRDDEVNISHPLRRVIGELPAAALSRVQLQRLSADGVDLLARRALRSPAGLFAATQGNPFFLSELLRHPADSVPPTVQDLVLGRFARLGAQAQSLVRLVSIVPSRMERHLLERLLPHELPDLEACLDAGLLVAEGPAIGFRHELARVAVESALSPPAAQSLHGRMLRTLEADGAAAARLAHHASGAGDVEAVRRYAPAAADEARRRGAFREAARHLRIALQQPGGAPDERRRWLDAYAVDSSNVDWHEEAIAAREELDTFYRRTEDIAGEAANLSRLALLYVYMMRNPQADAASRRAIELLESLPPGPELATAYGTEASLRMLNRDCEESAEWSRKSIAVAHAHGDSQRLCVSLSTLGTALMFIDYDAGCRQMEEALAAAREQGLPVAVANTLLNMGSGSGELMHLPEAEKWLGQAMAYAAEHELDRFERYSSAWLALCDAQAGRWAAAAERAARILDIPGIAAVTRVMALLALVRVRMRRGDPAVQEVLDQALVLAGPADTLQRIGPVRAARAEAAYARGDREATAAEALAALPLALGKRHPWLIGELAFWCWRAGKLTEAPPDCAEPYALQIQGRWRAAAEAWQRLGCPYEQARALADGDSSARQEALVLFDRLGARPSSDALRRQLQQAGVRGVPRGARASTRGHPNGLTTRELQVLDLLCQGMRNAEIAQRLSRSVRTVDHHLASVFAKLGVDSRVAAIQAAQRSGLAPQSGQSPAPN
jgi:DNA-binding CsgD family transcriptional regulator/tetratricopeptide (TPR) repeat protein